MRAGWRERWMRDGSAADRIRGEVIALAVLSVVALMAYGATSRMAVWQRRVALHDAEALYVKGTAQLARGARTGAVESLRQAHWKAPAERRYSMAFVDALVAAGRIDEARRGLVELRQAAPEDPEVNAALARLAGAVGDVAAAVRYYRSALYGVWPVDQDSARRQVRVELVRVLLGAQRRVDAVAELVALTASIPDTVEDHVVAGRLMLEAGEPRRALEQFGHGLSISPDDTASLSGAGEAAFVLRDYAAARAAFDRVSELPPALGTLRDRSVQVLDRDPLAARLTREQRRARVVAWARRLSARLETCRTTVPATGGPFDQVDTTLRAIVAQGVGRVRGDVADWTESVVDALGRIQRSVDNECGEADASDTLLGQLHRAGRS